MHLCTTFSFSFTASLVNEDGLYTGKIVIKSKNSQFKVTIPYRAHVLSGHPFVNESITHFHLKDRWGYEEDSQQESSSTDKTDTKDNKEGDIVHNPIGKYKGQNLTILTLPFLLKLSQLAIYKHM